MKPASAERIVPGALGSGPVEIQVIDSQIFFRHERSVRTQRGERLNRDSHTWDDANAAYRSLARQVRATAERVQSGSDQWANPLDVLIEIPGATIGEIAAKLDEEVSVVKNLLGELGQCGLASAHRGDAGQSLYSIT